MKNEIQKIRSMDGVDIALHRRGNGPPLILVPGSAAANPLAWTGVIPLFTEHFRVYAMDRRGHGESGDSEFYTLQSEIIDLATVIDAFPEPVFVLGHSFGGLIALEASLMTGNLGKVVLYEPGMPVGDQPVIPDGLLRNLQALLDVGDKERMLVTMYREIGGLQVDEIAEIRSSSAWPERMAIAHTIPREMAALAGYRFSADRFTGLHIPVLVLEGGRSSKIEKAANLAILDALPNCQLTVLHGQGHVAMYTAPDLFATTVLRFLLNG